MRQLRISKQITKRDSQSLDVYLRDISKLSLISVNEEVSLSRAMRAGDFKAREELVKANLRFVVSVAKQYQNQGLSLQDLINEGNLGLIKAAERYDETRGFKFISYAVWWIRQAVLQAIAEQSRIIRLPLNKVGSITKIHNEFIKLEQIFQREPVPEEIAELLKIQPEIVEDALLSKFYPISADAPLIESEDQTLFDILIIRDEPATDVPLVKASLRIEIERALNNLDPLEANILRYNFGLIGIHPLSIDETADIMGINCEKVRHLKDKALKKLRNNYKNRQLRSFLE